MSTTFTRKLEKLIDRLIASWEDADKENAPEVVARQLHKPCPRLHEAAYECAKRYIAKRNHGERTYDADYTQLNSLRRHLNQLARAEMNLRYLEDNRRLVNLIDEILDAADLDAERGYRDYVAEMRTYR